VPVTATQRMLCRSRRACASVSSMRAVYPLIYPARLEAPVSDSDKAMPPGPELSLRLWQRFHMRLTLLYGGAVFVVLAVMGLAFYLLTVHAKVDGLQRRLLGVATALADGIRPHYLESLQTPKDLAHPDYAELMRRFNLVHKAEPELTHIYIFRQG